MTVTISLLELAPLGALRALYIEIDLVNPNAEYEVEEILNCKYVRGRVKYLVNVTTCKTLGLRLGKFACTENRQQVSRDGPVGVRRDSSGVQGIRRDPDHEGSI